MLKKLYKEARGDAKNHIHAMRDQLRVMEHAYSIKKSKLPQLGGEIFTTEGPSGEIERWRLTTLNNLLVSEKFLTSPPPCPVPYALRP